MIFQSTHPLRGATISRDSVTVAYKFQSTHPLRGATIKVKKVIAPLMIFQSTHPLRGATLIAAVVPVICTLFQSTHPLRGATVKYSTVFVIHAFQSTHPLRGATTVMMCYQTATPKFQSTHPLRGATAKMHKIFCTFCDNRQFYRVSPSGVPSVGALFTYSRGLQRAGAGANLPVNGCALGLRAKASAGARLPSELRKRSLFKSRRSLLAPVRAAVPFQCNSRQQRTEFCPNFSA